MSGMELRQLDIRNIASDKNSEIEIKSQLINELEVVISALEELNLSLELIQKYIKLLDRR